MNKVSIIYYSIITFLIVNYFYPYIVDTNKIIIGFPLKWITIYDLYKNNKLYLTTHINMLYMLLNIALFYLFYFLVFSLLKKGKTWLTHLNKKAT